MGYRTLSVTLDGPIAKGIDAFTNPTYSGMIPDHDEPFS